MRMIYSSKKCGFKVLRSRKRAKGGIKWHFGIHEQNESPLIGPPIKIIVILIFGGLAFLIYYRTDKKIKKRKNFILTNHSFYRNIN